MWKNDFLNVYLKIYEKIYSTKNMKIRVNKINNMMINYHQQIE
jgi:hypothetical protein